LEKILCQKQARDLARDAGILAGKNGVGPDFKSEKGQI